MSLHYASTGKLKTQFMFTSSEALPIIKEIVAPKSTIVNEALIVPVTDLYQEFENIFSAFYPDGIPMTPEEVFEACEHFQDWSKGENTRYSNGVEKVVIDDVIGIDFEVFGAWFCSLLFNQLHDVVTNRLLDHTLRQVLSMRRRHPSLSIPSYLGSCRSQEEGSSRTFSELYMMGVPVQIPERERSLQLAALALLEKQKGSLQGIEESKDEEGIVDGVDECKGDDEYKENGCAEMERTVKIESLADNKVETERVVVNLDSIEVGIDGVEDGGEGTKEDGWKDVGGEGVMEVVEEKGEAAEEKGDDTVLEIHEIIVAEMEVVGDEGLMVEEIVAVIIEHEVVVIEKEEEMVLQKEQVVPEKEVEVVVAVVEEEMVVAEEANHDSIDPIPHPDQLESEEVRVLMEDVYTGKEVYIIPDEKETLPVEEVDEEEEVMMVGVEVGAEVGDEEGGVEGDEVVVRMDQVYSGKEVYVIDEEDKKNEDQFRSNGRMDESAISMISVTSVIDQGEEEGEEEQEEVGEEEGEEEGDETINEDDMCVNMQHSYSTEKGSEGTTMENVQENKQGNGLTELRTEKLSPWRDVYSMVNLDSPDSVVTQSFISPLQSEFQSPEGSRRPSVFSPKYLDPGSPDFGVKYENQEIHGNDSNDNNDSGGSSGKDENSKFGNNENNGKYEKYDHRNQKKFSPIKSRELNSRRGSSSSVTSKGSSRDSRDSLRQQEDKWDNHFTHIPDVKTVVHIPGSYLLLHPPAQFHPKSGPTVRRDIRPRTPERQDSGNVQVLIDVHETAIKNTIKSRRQIE